MKKAIVGKKIGMTQVFTRDHADPSQEIFHCNFNRLVDRVHFVAAGAAAGSR